MTDWPLLLVIDTATRASVVGIGHETPLAVDRRETRHRHGALLLEQIDATLAAAGVVLADVTAIAVGTGPGSFTGLRVGLATAKTLAYARGLPLVGVSSADTLRAAAVPAGAAPDATVVLPAGARDHYLAAADADPVLVSPGGLRAALGETPAFSVDLPADVLGADAVRLGEAAVDGLASALLQRGGTRLVHGDRDDVAELVPAYVALPRGVSRGAEEMGWSPDLR